MTQQFTITQPRPQVVEIRNGARGRQGLPGPEGPEGPQGASLTPRGAWAQGQTYNPGDAVTAASSASDGITSLFIQSAASPSSESLIPPRDDPTRWMEVGYREWGGAIGNLWRVNQPGHSISQIGMPVRFETAINGYVPADAGTLQNLALAVVREIPDANTLILQSSGLVPNVDPLLNFTTPGVWSDNAIYYLSTTTGRYQETPPPAGLTQAVMRIVNGTDAVIFPYQDVGSIPTPDPAPAPATAFIKLDDISGAFDDVTRDFPLTAGGPVPFGPAENFFIYIDGHAQEPNIDFIIIGPGDATIRFTRAPFSYADFWGRYATT